MAQLCIDLTLILGVNRCHVGVRWRVLIGVPLQKQLREGLSLSTAAVWGRLILRHEHCPVCLQFPPPHTHQELSTLQLR